MILRKGSVVADILLNSVKGTPVEEVQRILANHAVRHKVLGNAVLESLGEIKGLSDKYGNISWLAINSPPRVFLFMAFYTIWVQVVHLKICICYHLAIE